MEKLYVGKIVNTFGIKGELKISSDFEMSKRIFTKNNKIIINEKEELITGVKFHKGNYLVEINNIKDINEIEHYIGKEVYIYKDSLDLKQNEFLFKDLIGMKVVFNNENIGIITDSFSGINPLIKVNDLYFIPLQDNFIINKDFKNKKIICQNLEGLIE